MKIQITTPKIICIEFYQAKEDEDYGTCLWARFYFDTENFSLMIQSDCGDYSYSWPISEKESFLKLCSRINKNYLLEKISCRTDVDGDATFKNIKEHIDDAISDEDEDEIESLVDWDIDEIEDACNEHCSIEKTVEAIEDVLSGTYFSDLGSYDIYQMIATTFPYKAQKIADIYIEHIKPAIINYLEGENKA